MTNRDAAKEAVAKRMQEALDTDSLPVKFAAIRELIAELKELGFWRDPLRGRVELLEIAVRGRWDIERRWLLRRDAKLAMMDPNREIDELFREVIQQIDELMPK